MTDTVTHLEPPKAFGFTGRGYCGRRADNRTADRSRCTCTDCHAARTADEKANR